MIKTLIIVFTGLVLLTVFSLGVSSAQQSQQQQAVVPAGQAQAQQQPVSQENKADQEKQEKAKEEEVMPVMNIKPLEGQDKLYSFELRNVDIGDLFRVLAHDYKLNLILEQGIQGRITASLTSVTLEDALSVIAESQNLVLERKGNIIKVSPNLVTKTFELKFMEAKKLLEVRPKEGNAGSPATIYDLISNRGRVFLGNQKNSLIVMDYPSNLDKIQEFLNAVDQKMSSRVFKLKYLKAADVVGATTVTTTETKTTTEAGTATTTTTAATTEAK